MIIGILGGGQLARMLALAGIPLGYRFVFYDPAEDCCAASLGTHIQAGFDDKKKLKAFALSVDIVTYEFENVPLSSALLVEQYCKVYPEPSALEVSQDRWHEKQLFRKLGIPTAEFYDLKTYTDLCDAAGQLGYPFIVKNRCGGYDGKGQYLIRQESDLPDCWARLTSQPAIAERCLKFSREVSIIAARNRSGDTVYYDLAQNHHEDGILRVTRNCPDDPVQCQAKEYAEKLLQALNYVGVIALELFQLDDKLLANEFAPRVHNSGHWTIEGASTSQFENHIRAILDLPLGKTTNLGHYAMMNFIGKMPDIDTALAIPAGHFHQYGKKPRPGRKLGHLTLRSSSPSTLQNLVEEQLLNLGLTTELSQPGA